MRITVVGAGPSGLGCAVELARENDVTVVDRLPVPGGETGWENPEIKSFVETAKELGVSFELGSMATHWDGKSLLIVSPLGTQKIDSDFLSMQVEFAQQPLPKLVSPAIGQREYFPQQLHFTFWNLVFHFGAMLQ